MTPARSEHDMPSPREVFLAHLPLSIDEIFGREPELQILDSALNDGQPHIVALVAQEGMGKTALVSQWLRQILAQGARRVERIIGWSFTPSTTTEVSSDDFFAYALRACGDPEPAQGSPWNKGRRLSHVLRDRRAVLVLDNLHALQYRDGDMRGRLKDPGMKALLFDMSRGNPGLCVLTTSESLKDFEYHVKHRVKEIPIPALPPEAGVQLLRAGGVKGPADAIKNVISDFDAHPLALRLLGGYLLFTHRGDIRKLDLNSPLSKINQADKHVRRVIDGFTIWLQRKPELNILFLLGVCNQRIEGEALNAPYHNPFLAALLQSPPIKGLTEYVYECSENDWQSAIEHLLTMRLLTEHTITSDKSRESPQTANSQILQQCRAIDCHPLVRAYFATQFRTRLSGSWRETQTRLYDRAIQRAGHDLPDSQEVLDFLIDAMPPLFDAVRHGCAIDICDHVFQEMYWKRIHRGGEDFCATRLGAPGADLAALSHFFTPDWKATNARMSDENYARLLDIAAQRLRDLGRLREAAKLVKKGMSFWNTKEHWQNAAEHAHTLSELLLRAGEVEQAVIHARLALQLDDVGEDSANSVRMRIGLIRTLHLAGDIQEAEDLCYELEILKAQQTSEAAFLKTPPLDVVCCDLSLHLGYYQAVQKRINTRTFTNNQERSPCEHAVEKLLAGKTLLSQAIPGRQTHTTHISDPESIEERTRLLRQSKAFLDQAIEALWSDSDVEWLIHGFLVRAVVCRALQDFSAASADLEELREIAELAGMLLYRTDYHLESARLVYAQYAGEQGKFSSDADGEECHQKMHDHVEAAEALIWRTGYHLRDSELEELITLLKDAIPERVENADIAEHQQAINWLAPPQRKTPRPAKKIIPTPPPQEKGQKLPDAQKDEAPLEIVWGKVHTPKITPPVTRVQEILPPDTPEPEIPLSNQRPARRQQDEKPTERQRSIRQLRNTEGYDNVYLYPGELYIAERPTIVWTLLGSCIAVVLSNERLGIGAICHAQLPEERFRDKSCSMDCQHPCYRGSPDPSRFKYATCSIRYLYDQFIARGITSDEITVKLFGGAAVLDGVPDTINVGEENINVARKVLQEYNLKIVRKDVGGRRGRTLYFYSDTGEVFMKKHRSNEER